MPDDGPHGRRLKTRKFYAENCCALLVHKNPEEHLEVYKKPDGGHIFVTAHPGQTEDHKVVYNYNLENPSEAYAAKQTDWEGKRWQDPEMSRFETRRFYRENCCAILVHKELDPDDKNQRNYVKIYKTPSGGAITTFIWRGREEYRVHKEMTLGWVSEMDAMNLQRWPGMDWQRPPDWQENYTDPPPDSPAPGS